MSTEQDKDSFSLKRNRGNVDFPCFIGFDSVSVVIAGATAEVGLQAFGEEQKSRLRHI